MAIRREAVLCASYAWGKESFANRDLTNGASLVRPSEGSNIAAVAEGAIYDETTVQLGVVCAPSRGMRNL